MKRLLFTCVLGVFFHSFGYSQKANDFNRTEIIHVFLDKLGAEYLISNELIPSDLPASVSLVEKENIEDLPSPFVLEIESITINRRNAVLIAKNYSIPKPTVYMEIHFRKKRKKWEFKDIQITHVK